MHRKLSVALAIAVALIGTVLAGQAGAATPLPGGLLPAKATVKGVQPQSASAAWVRLHSLYGNGGQCLDADANNGANGTRVQVWTCNGSSQQEWFSTDDGFLINGRFQSMCLDADLNGQGNNGTVLQLWQCNGSSQQQWGFRANDLAMYSIRFLNNFNTCVDRDTNGPDNGARAQLWQKNFQPQQWWEVLPG